MKKNKLNSEQGKRLKECLIDKNMLQKELAKKAGYTPQYISNIVSCKKPLSLESARCFSKILGVTEEYLLCESNFKTEAERYMYDEKHSTHIRDCIDSLIESNGYKYIGDFIGNWDTLSFEPYTNIKKYSDFARLALTDANFFNYINDKIKPMSEIETPSGERIVCTFDEFLVTMNSIQRFALFAMETLKDNYERNKKHLPTPNDNNRVNRNELATILFPNIKQET